MTKETIEEFKKIYKSKTGQEISDQDALESATKLITLVKAIYRPIKQEEANELNKKDGIRRISPGTPGDN